MRLIFFIVYFCHNFTFYFTIYIYYSTFYLLFKETSSDRSLFTTRKKKLYFITQAFYFIPVHLAQKIPPASRFNSTKNFFSALQIKIQVLINLTDYSLTNLSIIETSSRQKPSLSIIPHIQNHHDLPIDIF